MLASASAPTPGPAPPPTSAPSWLRRARLPDGRLADVQLAAGRIAAIAPSAPAGPDTDVTLASRGGDVLRGGDVDLGGALLTPGLTDPHLHPDKAFGLDDAAASDQPAAASLREAIAQVRAAKVSQTAAGIAARTGRLFEWCLRRGTTRVRVHAEVDPLLGLRSVEGVLAARAAFAGRLHVQVVAFPQEGIRREPGTAELLAQALDAGCDVVGAITYQDPDPRAHLELTAGLAQARGLPLDVHADFGVPPAATALPGLAEITRHAGLGGRVLAGHCTTLAAMPPIAQTQMFCQLAEARVAVCALPRTDLFMDGRVAPLAALRAAGVDAWLGSNNILNAFTPVGPPALPSVAAVYALLTRTGSIAALDELAWSLWAAARALGEPEPAIAVGAAADLCVWPVRAPWQIVATEAEPLAVYVGGQLAHGRQGTGPSVVSPGQGQPSPPPLRSGT